MGTAFRNRVGLSVARWGLVAACLPLAPLVAQVPTEIPPTHTVKTGDTLWDLAAKYLGDPFKWPEIYRLNTDVVQDPHWIYPGEVLKLPGARPAVAPPAAAAPTPPATVIVPPAPDTAPAKTVFRRNIIQPIMRDTHRVAPEKPGPTVRFGEYIAAPWIDKRGGPTTPGRIIGSAELPGIASAEDRPFAQLYDQMLFSPPIGAVAPEGERYISYITGPLLEGIGQVIIPTGVISVTRAPRSTDAGVARVVQMFGSIQVHQKLIPFDSTVLSVTGRATPISGGPEGRVSWIHAEPVLPTMQRYIVVSLKESDGVKIGDELLLYQPRQVTRDVGVLAVPEIVVGRAQVIRVTPYATTAMISVQDQPKISTATAARVIGRVR
jgi:LysM repeat protein